MLQQSYPLQVTVSADIYNQPNRSSELLTSNIMVACIEPNFNRRTFIPNVVEKFVKRHMAQSFLR